MLSTDAETFSAPSPRRRTAAVTACSPRSCPASTPPSATTPTWCSRCSCAGTPGSRARSSARSWSSPPELETAVLTAWRRTAAQLAGVRAILDAQRAEPATPEVGEALARADRKDWTLLAAMAGRAGAADPAAARIGRRLEETARAAYDPTVGTAPGPASGARRPARLAARPAPGPPGRLTPGPVRPAPPAPRLRRRPRPPSATPSQEVSQPGSLPPPTSESRGDLEVTPRHPTSESRGDLEVTLRHPMSGPGA